MAPPPRRPRPRAVGDVRLRVARGPRADGRWYWRASIYQDAEERTVWTGWGTPAEADTAVAAIVAGGTVDQPRQPDRADTIRDLCEYYLGRQEARADLAPVTVQTIRVMLRRVVASIGDVRIERLDGGTLERHRDARLRAGGAGSTIRAELVRLRAAWVWGQEVGLVPPRHLPRVRVPTEPVYSRATPTRGDVVAVLAQLEAWERLAVYLYAATGARVGELADVTWSDLDLERATLQVEGKTGRRVVPLSPPMIRELEDWRAQHPPTRPDARVLGVRGSTVRAHIWGSLARACDAAGVPRFSAQGLRRAAVDALYRSGVDPAAAASVVGHSPAVAMQAYRRATEGDRRQAVAMARLGYLEEGDVVAFKPRGRGRS